MFDYFSHLIYFIVIINPLNFLLNIVINLKNLKSFLIVIMISSFICQSTDSARTIRFEPAYEVVCNVVQVTFLGLPCMSNPFMNFFYELE